VFHLAPAAMRPIPFKKLFARRCTCRQGSKPSTGGFSTGSGAEVLLGWNAVVNLSLADLSDRLLAAFSDLAAAAHHPDPAYVAWYRAMLAQTAPRGLIYFSADFPMPDSGVGVLGCDFPEGIRTPPAS